MILLKDDSEDIYSPELPTPQTFYAQHVVENPPRPIDCQNGLFHNHYQLIIF